jgi:hypothetical protein
MDTVTTQERQRGDAPGAGDFYVIVSEYGTWYVAPDAAARVGRALARGWLQARWVRFVDISGSRIWLRTCSIESVYECTELIRERDRRFHYLRRKEARDDRRWDDDER